MKLKLPLILLGAVLAATAQADQSAYDSILSRTKDSNNNVSVTISDGDYSSYNMYGFSSKDTTGWIGGACDTNKASNESKQRFNDVEITVNGGSGIEFLFGTGIPNNSVAGDTTITINNGTVDYLIGGTYYTSDLNSGTESTGTPSYLASTGDTYWYSYKGTGQDINITVNGGTVGTIRGGNDGSEKHHSQMDAATEAEKQALLADKPWAISGDVNITINGGKVGTGTDKDAIRGGGGSRNSVDGAVNIKIGGDAEITGNVVAGARNEYGSVGSTNIEITGGTINGNVFGGGCIDNGATAPTVEGDTKITITDGTINGSVYGGGQGDLIKGNTTIELLGGTITGSVSGDGIDGSTRAEGKTATLKVGSAEQAYTGSVGSIGNFSEIIVAKGSSLSVSNGNIFAVKHHDITLSALNLTQAAISASTADVEGPITLNISADGKLQSGQYMVIQTEEPVSGWSAENVSVSGIAGFEDLQWQGNVLYFIYRSSNVDALAAANWGVFKSSQAFAGTLHGPHTNSVTLDPYGKGGNRLITSVWGTIYGHSSRIGSNGADYTLWGGAIGAERALTKGRSIGAAIGYDWGKVKPFTTNAVEQDTAHIGLYGRAWHKNLNSTDSVSIDWSAAYGSTTSSHSSIAGDWTQDSLQLDARGNFYRALSDQTAVNFFAGMQYYAQGSDSTGGMKAGSMQNLRLQAGAGIAHTINRATWFGEVALHQDLLRDNPKVKTPTMNFGCTNPGRFGATFSAGVEYRINDSWSLNARYSFGNADDQTEHNISAGAVYKF